MDAAKGVCMLIIMCCHIGVDIHVPMSHTVQTTAFFLISGFFFSTKMDGNTMLRKGVLNILVPFVIFYVLSYSLFYVGTTFVPNFGDLTTASGILDCFTQRQYFNGPLWFLLCLFWVRCFVWLILRLPKEWMQIVAALILGWGGHFLGYKEIFIPLCLDIALSSVPVFMAGVLIKKHVWLDKFNKVDSGIFAVVFYTSCLAIPIVIENSLNYSSGSYSATCYVSLAISISLVFLSKSLLDKSKLFAFIGRNTMWLMCTHHLVYRPVKIIVERFVDNHTNSSILIFVITLAICLAVVPLVNEYTPWLVGKNKLNKKDNDN